MGAILALVSFAVWKGTRGRDALLDPDSSIESPASDAADSDSTPSAHTDEKPEGKREAVAQDATRGADLSAALAPTHRVIGRVVDEHRNPVAGARVKLGRAHAGDDHAISAEDGRFVLSIVDDLERKAYIHDCLIATDENSRAGILPVSLRPARAGQVFERKAGTLVLFAAHELTLHVRHEADAAAHASVQVYLGRDRLERGVFHADAAGDLHLTGLPAGRIHARATWDGSEGRTTVFVPEEHEATIQLEACGVVDVFVVDSESRVGIWGAQIEVREGHMVPAATTQSVRGPTVNESYTTLLRADLSASTDDKGVAHVAGLVPGRRYEIAVKARDYQIYPAKRRSQTPRIALGDDPLVVVLESSGGRSVSWPITAGDVPVPADGSLVTVRAGPGNSLPGDSKPDWMQGQMEGRTLVVDGITGHGIFEAVAADGARAVLWLREGELVGKPASFHRARRIDVRVRDPHGDPVPGAQLRAYNQGNNALGESVSTDEQGCAVIDGLDGLLVQVRLVAPGARSFMGEVVGTVDLEREDGAIDVTYAAPRRSRARLTLLVDGQPRLPARFQVVATTGVTKLEEFPGRGELTFEVGHTDDGEPVTVQVRARGFSSASVDLRFVDEAVEAVARIELERESMLVARVVPPREGRMSITAQRFDRDKQKWSEQRSLFTLRELRVPNGPDGQFLFAGVDAGRWRVRDNKSGLTSSEVVIEAGGGRGVVDLDLSVIEWVTGRVELPDPAELARVRVLSERPARDPLAGLFTGFAGPGVPVSSDGSFKLSVTSERDVSIFAWHPWLVPAADSGRVTLHGGRDGVVLRLVEGDALILPNPQLAGRWSSPRVARYAAGTPPEGEPLEWHYSAFQEGELRCSLPLGRWNLLVVPTARWAPLTLSAIEIDGMTRVPDTTFGVGSSVHVRVLVAEGNAPPRIYVRAERVGAPVYSRSINSRGEDRVSLGGLGPGTYRISLSAFSVSATAPEQTVKLDGKADVELEFDLR